MRGSGRAASWVRAFGRSLRPSVWNVAVLLALALVAASAAAVPLVRAATDQAALADALAGVPAGAGAADAAVAEVVTGSPPWSPAGSSLLNALGAVRGLADPVVLGQSLGPELNTGTFYPRTVPVVRARGTTARARLVAVERPQDRLQVTARVEAAPAGPGVWLPGPLAAQLGVRAGDVVDAGTLETVAGVTTPRTLPVTVLGLYATTPARRPLGPDEDPAGGGFWTASWVRLPPDSELPSQQAWLAVADLDSAKALLEVTKEPALWTTYATLTTAPTTLEAALVVREDVLGLDNRAAEVSSTQDRISTDVVSGIPRLVGAADAVARAVRSTTSGQAWAGVGLALAVVLGLAAIGARRRATELRAVAAQGRHPLGTAVRFTAQTVPPAAVAVLAGTWAATAGARGVYPLDVSAGLLREAARRATTATLAAVVLTFAATLVAAVVAARPARAGVPPRPAPWPWLLAAAAVAAAAGVLTRPSTDVAQGLDVLAPALVVAAVAAVGARLVTRVLAAAARRTVAGTAPRLPAGVLVALRRSGRSATTGGAVVTTFAAGLALLLFALTTSAGVLASVDEKAAVVSGAAARSSIEGSWVLDPTAPERPEPKPGEPVVKPPVRTPPLPDGTTMVWRDTVSFTTTGDLPRMLVVDPASFERAVSWGRSAELAQGRAALRTLARTAADRQATLEFATDRGIVPALLVGPATARVGDEVVVSGGGTSFRADIVAGARAFPGLQRRDSLLVVPADALFTVLVLDDPRLRGDTPGLRTELWTRDGVEGLHRVLDPARLPITDVVTLDQERQAPAFVAARRTSQYRVALGVLAALVALAVLLAGVDRTLVEGRAEDVLLARVGLGRGGVARARTLETATLVVTGTLLALAGTAAALAVVQRMVDPDAGLAPPIVLRPDGGSTAVLLLAAAGAWLATLVVVVRRTTADDAAEVIRDAR